MGSTRVATPFIKCPINLNAWVLPDGHPVRMVAQPRTIPRQRFEKPIFYYYPGKNGLCSAIAGANDAKWLRLWPPYCPPNGDQTRHSARMICNTLKRRLVSVPPHAHPLARLVFGLMREAGMGYADLEWKSGVLGSTVKSWRVEKTPSIQSIEAALGVFGWRLVPIPPMESLSPETHIALDGISLDFISDDSALGTLVANAITKAGIRAKGDNPAPRLNYDGPYWRDAA